MKKILVFCLIIPLLTGSPLFAASPRRTENANNLREKIKFVELSDKLETLLETYTTQFGKPDGEQEASGNNAPREIVFNPLQTENTNNLRDETRLVELSDEIETLLELYTTQFGEPDGEQEASSNNSPRETMFVTGIEGDLYEYPEDIPATVRYLYYRPSDGAVFVGTLTYYYFRIGYLNPSKPLVRYYQAFYEGTLTLQHYVD